MSIDAFIQKYATSAQPIDAIVRRWIAQREVRDFLGMPILAGGTMLDLLMGDQLVDTLSPDAKQAFKALMGVKAESRAEVERLILDKLERGDESIRGLMNKIQSQIGEDVFGRLAGPAAHLADDKSQEGWDVWVDRGDHTQYVQVKVYADVDGVGRHLRALQEKLLAGTIRDGENPLTRLDIAVNSEIYDEARTKAAALNYPGDILDLGETRAVMRDALKQSVDHIKAPFEHFFGELLGDALQPAIFHAMANAFLLYKGAKNRRMAVEDTLYSAGLSAGGLLAATSTDHLLGHGLLLLDLQDAAALMSGPVGGILLLGINLSTRAVLRRILDRRFTVQRLEAETTHLAAVCTRLEASA
jgi:hypothetical protein